MRSVLLRWAASLALTLLVCPAWSASSDFNGDGKNDIVWRQVSTGHAVLHLMSGGTLLSSNELGGNTDWNAVATGDFNGDGKTDILWRHAFTGNVLLSLTSSGAATALGGNRDWSVAAVADFDGDGKSDILWRQFSTGRVIVYLMNGGSVLNAIDLGGNTDWAVATTGDFNGDARGDILWRQLSTGKVLMYLMNGGAVLNASDLGGNTDWNPVATGDFNGDGKADILWRQVSTGKVLMHQMNSGAVLSAFDLGGNTDWSPVATGDFNGDGMSDIVWRQVSTGIVFMHTMNGAVVTLSTGLGGNTDWRIASGATSRHQGCDPFPQEIRTLLAKLPVVDGLCLIRAPSAEASNYQTITRTLFYRSPAPATGELGTLAHEVCHAHQHRAILDAGLPEPGFDNEFVPGWAATPEGRGFVELTGWLHDPNADQQIPPFGWTESCEPWSCGYQNPIEDAAEFCATYFDPGHNSPSASLLETIAPRRLQWARQRLP